MTSCRVLHVTTLTSLRMVKVTFGKTSRTSDIYPKYKTLLLVSCVRVMYLISVLECMALGSNIVAFLEFAVMITDIINSYTVEHMAIQSLSSRGWYRCYHHYNHISVLHERNHKRAINAVLVLLNSEKCI